MDSRLRVLPLTKRLSMWSPGDVSKMVSLVALFSDWSAVSFMGFAVSSWLWFCRHLREGDITLACAGHVFSPGCCRPGVRSPGVISPEVPSSSTWAFPGEVGRLEHVPSAVAGCHRACHALSVSISFRIKKKTSAENVS